VANGFGHVLYTPASTTTCHSAPYAFHPEYSTANPRGNTWSAHTYNVAMSDEIRKRYDVLLTELRASGVTAIDVRDAFKTVIAGKQEVFYRADFHWTTFAAEATADQVATSILSSGPLPGKSGTGMKLGDWINDRHLGDLAANFLSPERKRAIGPEAYVIRQAPKSDAAKADAGLLDSDPAPVAVVGNSFVQPYFGFSQRLSNKIDRPVSLKWNPGDIGPWATRLHQLDSAASQAEQHVPLRRCSSPIKKFVYRGCKNRFG